VSTPVGPLSQQLLPHWAIGSFSIFLTILPTTSWLCRLLSRRYPSGSYPRRLKVVAQRTLLAWDSFGKLSPATPFYVTPSVKKVGKKPTTTSSNVVLSENCGSNDEIVYIACHRKRESWRPCLLLSHLKWKSLSTSKPRVKTCQRLATLAIMPK
jgi:hypothetical protein